MSNHSILETFRSFKDTHAAEDLALWLSDRGIKTEVADTAPYFDPSFANNAFHKEWAVRLPAADFSRATELLHHFYIQRLRDIPKDYYLFAFSDAELLEILQKPDEWGDLDYALAQQVLQTRGKPVTDVELQALRDKRYTLLSQPEEPDGSGFIGWGYGFSLIGGIVGSMIGLHLMTSHKILPDGKKVPRYNERSRVNGRRIFWLGIIVSLLFYAVKIYLSYERNMN